MSFLKAEWRKLAIANYVVEPKVLEKYLPYKTELDIWEDKCYMSLIGFMFCNTKIVGLKIPFHVNFEEVNLRFYVRYKQGSEWRRGVVFVKELVPRHAITLIANTLYHEHYQTVKMSHEWMNEKDQLKVKYQFDLGGKSHSIAMTAKNELIEIPANSETEFITEHYWGYTEINEAKTTGYEVTHPRWQTYEVLDCQIDLDFVKVYGEDFAFLNNQRPYSVMLAEGSEITVEGKEMII
ncbi:MAG TPA: DUF2071 domain-containing protein [Chitinophagaceae bacterium]|nr:DUF2071 domain-containing protein [Chitinophagaceae bacterium]